jgi:hypothetical protein
LFKKNKYEAIRETAAVSAGCHTRRALITARSRDR